MFFPGGDLSPRLISWSPFTLQRLHPSIREDIITSPSRPTVPQTPKAMITFRFLNKLIDEHVIC